MKNSIDLCQSHCIASFIRCAVLVQSLITLRCYFDFAWVILWGDIVMKQA